MNAVSHHRLVRHLDLFSGIGGFALAAQMAGGIETVAFCEIEEYPQLILAKNFPNVPIHGDVRTLNPNTYGRIDLITGGYPCQPFSSAGKRKGQGDDRYLWPEMLRVIQEIQPTWVVGENVGGIIGVELDKVLFALEGIGYEVEALVIPACAVNAPHRRDRVWIVANTISTRGARRQRYNKANRCSRGEKIQSQWCVGKNWKQIATRICGVDDGLPKELDRLKSLGNAIVPQVAYEIFRHIDKL